MKEIDGEGRWQMKDAIFFGGCGTMTLLQ